MNQKLPKRNATNIQARTETVRLKIELSLNKLVTRLNVNKFILKRFQFTWNADKLIVLC